MSELNLKYHIVLLNRTSMDSYDSRIISGVTVFQTEDASPAYRHGGLP